MSTVDPKRKQPQHVLPRKGERWISHEGGRTCRVMADPVEGYVMARFKGAGPWLLHVNDWHKKFKPTPLPTVRSSGSTVIRCHADRDGDCIHMECPQNRDGEPHATGRHCPLDVSPANES